MSGRHCRKALHCGHQLLSVLSFSALSPGTTLDDLQTESWENAILLLKLLVTHLQGRSSLLGDV